MKRLALLIPVAVFASGCCLLPIPVYYTHGPSVKGTVLEVGTDRPIQGAKITIRSDLGSCADRFATTAADGSFRVPADWDIHFGVWMATPSSGTCIPFALFHDGDGIDRWFYSVEIEASGYESDFWRHGPTYDPDGYNPLKMSPSDGIYRLRPLEMPGPLEMPVSSPNMPEPPSDLQLVRRWCESVELPDIFQHIDTVPEDVASSIERLEWDHPQSLSAAFAILLLRDYAHQRDRFLGGFTLEPAIPMSIVEWEAKRLGYPEEFPPSAQAQLVSSMMASAIVRHADEIFANDPSGRALAEQAKTLLESGSVQPSSSQSPAADESHAEGAAVAGNAEP